MIVVEGIVGIISMWEKGVLSDVGDVEENDRFCGLIHWSQS